MIYKVKKETIRKSAKEFLRSNKIHYTSVIPLAADASFRKYYRVFENKNSYVLMDAPPKLEPIESFLKIASWLKKNKLPSPEIYAKDIKNGYILLEDFGDKNISQFLHQKTNQEKKIYKESVDILIKISQKSPPSYAKEFSSIVLMEEINLFIEWYLKLADVKLNKIAINEWIKLWENKFKEIKYEKRVLVLRDFHAENLMWYPKNHNTSNLGLLDFQDALSGHQAYDLVSLLQDVRRNVSKAIEQEMKLYFLDSSDIKDKKNFLKAYNILAAQRNIKILGIFSRLFLRDNKRKYLKLIPYTWSLVKSNIRNPELSDINIWFGKYIPDKRI